MVLGDSGDLYTYHGFNIWYHKYHFRCPDDTSELISADGKPSAFTVADEIELPTSNFFILEESDKCFAEAEEAGACGW